MLRHVVAASALILASALHKHGLLVHVEPADKPAVEALELAYGYDNFWHTPSGSYSIGEDDRDTIMKRNNESEWKAGIYGEIKPEGIISMLRTVGAKPGMRFYDLGSGTGKFVAIARQVFGLHATGIELSNDRHHIACKAAGKLDKDAGGSIRLVHGSFLDYDFSDADIIFSDNVEFSRSMNQQLAKLAGSMRKGATAVLCRPDAWTETGKYVENSHMNVEASWTSSTSLHILQKVMEPEAPTGLRGVAAAADQCGLRG
eukprot:CAMPEP_0197876476 /NCGR_PEP_ID=MMETSP1439-20131203/5434_1 /TAXON_ID=66791 /ORGANISM="Gonyaulax spinifera, Strain CCMP409" /LENGTH=258 /DNA_ID=CAMNT_0043495759 /DNA_START=96 /DNA_END=872 /DNA_ORIENTATION=+